MGSGFSKDEATLEPSQASPPMAETEQTPAPASDIVDTPQPSDSAPMDQDPDDESKSGSKTRKKR